MVAMVPVFNPISPVVAVSENVTLGWLTFAGVVVTALGLLGVALINNNKQNAIKKGQATLQTGQDDLSKTNKEDHGVVYGDLVIVKEDVQKLAESQLKTREDVVRIREHIVKVEGDLQEARLEIATMSDRNYAAIEALAAGLAELKSHLARYISENPQTIKTEEVHEATTE